MKRVGFLLGGLLLVWVGSWLPLGLSQGQPTLLLRPQQASEALRQIYLGELYCGLLIMLTLLWKKAPPGPVPGSSWGEFFQALCLGWLFVLMQRGLLWAANCWSPALPSPAAWHSALLFALPLAAVEEVVFRGYLYGVLREEKGRWRGAIAVSLLFAVVHLFRPGDMLFKLAYFTGLLIASLVLVLMVERGGLGAAIGLHTSWVSSAILDPPSRTVPGFWSGLNGEPAAGLSSWLMLLLLAGLSLRAFGKERDIAKFD